MLFGTAISHCDIMNISGTSDICPNLAKWVLQVTKHYKNIQWQRQATVPGGILNQEGLPVADKGVPVADWLPCK